MGSLRFTHDNNAHIFQADATRRRGCDDAPQYDSIISAGTEKAFFLRQVYQDRELRLLQRDRGRRANVAASLNGLPRPPALLAEGGLEPEPQQQVGPARMANAMRGRRRSASLSGSGSEGSSSWGGGGGGFSSGDGSGNGGKGATLLLGSGGGSGPTRSTPSSAGWRGGLGSGGGGGGSIVSSGGDTMGDLVSDQQHEAAEAGWRRLRSASMSGGRSVSGGSRGDLSCAGLHRIDLLTDAAAATSSPALQSRDLLSATIAATTSKSSDSITPPSEERVTMTESQGTVEEEEEKEGEGKEPHWVPPSPPTSLLASISTRCLLDCFALATDEDSPFEVAAVDEGPRWDNDARCRCSSSCGGGGSGSGRGRVEPLLDPQEADRYLRSSVSSSGGYRVKPLLELRSAFSSVTRGRVSACSGGPAADRHRLSQSGNGRQCSDDDDDFVHDAPECIP